VNSIESPELALCDWQPFSAMLQENGNQQSQLHVSEQYQNRVDYGLLEPFALVTPTLIPCETANSTLKSGHPLARLRERWFLPEG
jgi:hypothetical protein